MKQLLIVTAILFLIALYASWNLHRRLSDLQFNQHTINQNHAAWINHLAFKGERPPGFVVESISRKP